MTERENKDQLPKGWKWVKLGEAVNVLDNIRKPINSSERNKRIAGKDKNELFPYYGATGQVGWIDNFLTDGDYILVGEDGAPFLDVFKSKAYKIRGKTWVNNHAHILQEIKDISNNNFILHYLNSIDYRQYVNGTTRLKLTKGNLVEIPFPLAPNPTQLAIVSKIEELFSELDNGIESLLTAKQQLKTYRQSVVKCAFERKLTNGLDCDSFDLHDVHDLNVAAEPEVEYKTAKNQGNQKNNLNQGSDKRGFPKEWKWVKIDYLLSHPKKGMATGPFGTMLKKNEHQKGGVPVLGIENIGEGIFQMPNKIFITNEKALELKNFRVKENDIIISRSGTVGEICLLPKNMENSIISTNLIRVSLNISIINPKYFVYLFQGGKVRQQVFELCKGSSRAFLNQTILNTLDFPYCSIEEQNLIIQAIESRFSVADKMEEDIAHSLKQAEGLRKSILKKAFEGKLV